MTLSPLYLQASDFPMSDWHWPNFAPAEMASHDGPLRIDADAMDKLQALRNAIGQPFHILSAYRTPAHNARVGGAPRSQHMQARAFDISMKGHDPHEVMAMARILGFHGIGQYPSKGFLHIDTRPATEAAEWNDGADFPYGEDDPAPAPSPTSHKRKVRRGGRLLTLIKGFFAALPAPR